MSKDTVVVQTDISPVEAKTKRKVAWYRSPWYNALILGLCNFLAPGIWNAMNSLGGGGDEEPYLVNAANALTFGLMVVSCFFLSGPCVRYFGIKWTLILGTIGYAPYAAGLYTHNRYGDGWSWFVLFGAALCGISAGLFWMAEAAIALSYPEPERQGRFLGLWLSFRVGGQILGGAVNLGVNVHRNTAGSVSYAVLIVFITLQALGPFVGLLVNPPEQVQRIDGHQVHLTIKGKRPEDYDGPRKFYHCFWVDDLRAMARLFVRREFLAILPLIAQAAYAEAVMFTYESLWFSVRARALGSFISGILALTVGNLLGAYLDLQSVSLKRRSRSAFWVILTLQGAWWIWATIITTEFRRTQPVFDWVDNGFGRGFALFLFWVAGFQLNYMFLFFVIGFIAKDQEEIIRYASLLRGTESAVQAVSYGLSSVPVMASVGSIYINFGLWGISLLPAWWVIRKFGVERE